MNADELKAFENGIKAEWESGLLPYLIHLCGGNEEQLLSIFKTLEPGDWVFSTHRNHYHALLAGIEGTDLMRQIRKGNSMFTFSRAHNFYSSAILAGCCGIAAGVAWSLKRANSTNKVICFLGDGAEEQGHFYEAALFVEANDLPCQFIIEDNGIQVDTPKEQRRPKHTQASRPLDHFKCVSRYFYERTYPHAGSGATHKIEFNREVIAKYLSP